MTRVNNKVFFFSFENSDIKNFHFQVRTKEESYDLEPVTPLIPPVGLHAIVLSSSTVVLTWMDSTLPRNQLIPDSRYYIVRYTLLEAGLSSLNGLDSLRYYSYIT